AAAGNPVTVTVTAQDPFGNIDPTYAGTVHFTSSDPSATLPADLIFVAGTLSRSGAVTFMSTGGQTLTATDMTSGITGTASVTVAAANATHFTVSAPASATAGASVSFTVTALDQFGNIVPGYSGTVHFTSSDGSATLPADTTLAGGAGHFTATFDTAVS